MNPRRLAKLAVRHYGFQRRWRRVRPHLSDPLARLALDRDMALYAEGRFGRYGKAWSPGDRPAAHDSLDWRLFKDGWPRRGRTPKWWDWACAGACHWLVNFNRRLAELAEPGREWLIVSSAGHSTVWGGGAALFDLNMEAMGVPAGEAWEAAAKKGLFVLGRGQEYRCGPPETPKRRDPR